jgi:hypothetical protein
MESPKKITIKHSDDTIYTFPVEYTEVYSIDPAFEESLTKAMTEPITTTTSASTWIHYFPPVSTTRGGIRFKATKRIGPRWQVAAMETDDE